MNTHAWLRRGSAGDKLKKEWKSDTPLPMADGGTMEAMTKDRLKGAAETLKNGGTVAGLICITAIGNNYSISGIRFQETRMEAAGRQFWSTNKGASAECPPAAPGMPSDGFWEENDPLFPAAWPAKCVLPVLIRDPASLPNSWQLLAMDEVVISFWKIVDFTQRRLDSMNKRLSETDVPEKEAEVLKKKVGEYEVLLENARKLARNVPISVEWFEDQAASDDRAVSLREENESLREHCGLSGWNKIAVIGGRRDRLKAAGLACGPDEVSTDMGKIKWGPGRQVTGPVAEKAIAIWNRAAQAPEVVDAIQFAQSRFGRDSPWEEYTKLIIVFGVCRSNAELRWAVETVNYEKEGGRRKGNHSNEELRKKASIINICLLRKKAIGGLMATFVQPAIDVVESLLPMQPNLKGEAEALKSLKRRYDNVQSFCHACAQEEKAAGNAAPGNLMQNLPKWCSLRCQRMLRQIMEGRKDGAFVGLCASPPKGGIGAIRFDPEIMQFKGFQDEIAEMKEDYDKWSQQRQGQTVAPGSSKDPPQTSEQQKKDPAAQEAEECDELVRVRGELASASKEVRMAHASMQVMPSTMLAITHAIQGSAAYKQASNNSSVHRVAMCYMVPCSWDAPRPGEGKQDRRSNLPMPLWVEDFESFVAACHALITAENENYAVVFTGRTKRGSAGMASEAGLAIESQIVDAFKKSEEKQAQTWRLKRITEIMSGQKGRSRGVIGASASRVEVVFLFYRGIWPSKMKSTVRTLIPGSTADDIWLNIPEVDFEAVPKMPYVVKKSVFEDSAWAAVSVANLPQQPDGDGDQNSDEEGAKGSKRTASGDKKSKKDAKKDDKKDDKKGGKKDDRKDGKKDGKKDDKRGGKEDERGRSTGAFSQARVTIDRADLRPPLCWPPLASPAVIPVAEWVCGGQLDRPDRGR